MTIRGVVLVLIAICGCLVLCLVSCKGKPGDTANVSAAEASPKTDASNRGSMAQPGDDAPPADKTGGFDGKLAFAHVAKQVSFGPRPSGSPALVQLQNYIHSELSSYGCKVDFDDFHADTPIGNLAMKNVVAKIPGDKAGIIMLATHYDTARSARDPSSGEVHAMPNFVGADDGGSSTAVMLELARLLCSQHVRYAIWITFLDGEEAMHDWSATDSCYGSRQMAAKLAVNGDLKKIKAFLLADIVGGRNARFLRESSSTTDLVNLFWNTAHKLGYSDFFRDEATSAQDDHDPFLKRGVPSVDVIGDFISNGYWHTPEDNLDKISAKTLAVVGHVFLESIKQLQSK